MIQLIITNNDTYLWWKKVKWECPDDLSMEETIEMLKAVLRTLSWSEKQIEDMIPDCDKCISERDYDETKITTEHETAESDHALDRIQPEEI